MEKVGGTVIVCLYIALIVIVNTILSGGGTDQLVLCGLAGTAWLFLWWLNR